MKLKELDKSWRSCGEMFSLFSIHYWTLGSTFSNNVQYNFGNTLLPNLDCKNHILVHISAQLPRAM